MKDCEPLFALKLNEIVFIVQVTVLIVLIVLTVLCGPGLENVCDYQVYE